MKAVRFHAARDVRVEDVPAPTKVLEPNQVLVKPIMCGICGTDLHEYIAGPIVTPSKPHPLSGAQNPQILGHEFSAIVVDHGSAVRHVKAGDRVSIQPLVTPRDDYFARRGLYHLNPNMACIGLSWEWGGMGEFAVVNDYNVTKIPDAISDIQGAMVEPAAVALYGVERGGVGPGSTVLVSGGGPIGAMTVLAARAAGASKIFVSEPNTVRRRIAADLVPGVIAFDPTQADALEMIRDHTEEGVGVDVALECVGLERSLNFCVDAVRRGGKVVQVGLHMKNASVDPMLWALKDISIEATWCYQVQMWPRIMAMIGAGQFPVEKVVTSEIDAEDVVAKGFEELLDSSGKNLKVLVRV